MPYRLVVHPLSGKESFERQYDQPVVMIGRDEMSDLVLLDSRSLTSRNHVEIREKGKQFTLVDLGSRNGTRLNNMPLKPGDEYTLSQGDRILIGGYEIDFIPVSIAPVDPPTKPITLTDPQSHIKTPAGEIEALLAELNRVYCDHLDETPENRMNAMKGILKRAIGRRDVDSASELLLKVESRYRMSALSENETAKQSPPQMKSTFSNDHADVKRSAYDGLLKIAKHYIDDLDDLKSAEGMEKFAERIEKVMGVMVTSLAGALRSRRSFEQEFDVDATRLLSWDLNPIKEFGTEKEIGKYLLDKKQEEKIDKVITDLKEGFRDLAFHHLGLIAGFKECLRGLLEQLNPDQIEIEGSKGSGKIFKVEPMRSRAAWKLYRDKYKRLREEEVKTFETILGPYIAKGYLSVQEKKQTS